jgi:hypothetical protein
MRDCGIPPFSLVIIVSLRATFMKSLSDIQNELGICRLNITTIYKDIKIKIYTVHELKNAAHHKEGFSPEW